MIYSKRLKILSPDEINAYFGQPQFNEKERLHYFSLSHTQYQLMESFSATTQWYFILQLGYFKAKKCFFSIDLTQVSDDLHFITLHYSIKYPKSNVSEDTHLKIRSVILQHFNYQDDTKSLKRVLMQKAIELISCTNKPRVIFDTLYDFLVKSQFILLQYSTMQDLIGQALKHEKSRMEKVIERSIPKYARKALDKLLSTEKNYYEITLIKKDQKNFKYAEVTKIIQFKNECRQLYQSAQKIIPKLYISNNMVDYYASLVNHYPVDKLKKLSTNTLYLYLLCYIFRRIEKFNDNLASSFAFYVDKYIKSAKEDSKTCIYELKLELNKYTKKDVPKILHLFIDKSIADTEIRKKGFQIISEEKFEQVIKYISGIPLDEEPFRWAHYEKKHHEITKNIRPIFLSLDLKCSQSYCELENAIIFLKYQFNNNKILSTVATNDFPLGFIPKNNRPYIYETSEMGDVIHINSACYEFCVYLEIRKGFKDNEVTIVDSISNKNLIDDLVPRHKRKFIMEKLNNTLLSTPFKELFMEHKNELDDLYHHVNQRIINGENKSIKIKRVNNENRLVLLYNNKEDLTNHDFFSKLPIINIIDVLRFVHKKTNFLDAFTHIKPHYAKAEKDNLLILAASLANATHHGTYKMSDMANMSYQSLKNTENNFIRLDTLKYANDCISEAIAELPIYADWCIEPDKPYGSVDGQKFQTRIDVLQARNSAKYFPLKKGISAYTLLANFIPLNLETISPNLHESYFLFDILKNMTANIKLDYVSGDSHSINPVNFLLTRYLPIQFAPHLVHINSKIKNLCSFGHPSQFNDFIIKPYTQVDTSFILSEEENINWIIASLLQGEVRQNIIIRKLSSLARHHPTCQAMSQYNRVFESIYTLNYIDNPALRQDVRGALNRLEAYHQLRRAIALANGGEFRGNSEVELANWNECARLVANAIIYYNGCLLSALLKKYKVTGDISIINIIKRISPIAWLHINMLGKFDFFAAEPQFDIESIIEKTNYF